MLCVSLKFCESSSTNISHNYYSYSLMQLHRVFGFLEILSKTQLHISKFQKFDSKYYLRKIIPMFQKSLIKHSSMNSTFSSLQIYFESDIRKLRDPTRSHQPQKRYIQKIVSSKRISKSSKTVGQPSIWGPPPAKK